METVPDRPSVESTEPGLFKPGDLPSLITTGIKPRKGDILGWRAIRPDFTSRDSFRWPFPGHIARQDGPADGNDCGQGLHIAKTWIGAAMANYPTLSVLIVSYNPGNILGESENKLRVSSAKVLELIDIQIKIRQGLGFNPNLEGANLEGANLRGANFEGANLCGANLDGANLERANLDGANLEGGYLWGANLWGVNLREANLRRTNLCGVNLRGANLEGANLERANLRGAIGLYARS